MKSLTTCVAFAISAAAAACDSPSDVRHQEQWRLADAPIVVIGSAAGDSAYLFERVRTAHFASADRIVVVDAGLQVLRVFDSTGRFLNQIGGPGEGPGEFRGLRDAWMVSPDTIGVWDSRALRLSYFTVDGDLTRTATIRPTADLPASPDFLVGSLSDGSVIIGAVGADHVADRRGRPDRVYLAHFDPNGGFLGTIAVVDGLIRAPMGRVLGPIPFSPFPYAAVLHDSVLFTDGSRPSVQINDLDWHGREIQFPPQRAAPDSAWAELRSALEARNDWQLQLLSEAPRTDSIPHIAGLLVDDQSRIWTKQFNPSTDALWLEGGQNVGGGTWWIGDPNEGRTTAIVLPGSLRPVDIRQKLLLGILTDSLGVHRIAEFQIMPGRFEEG